MGNNSKTSNLSTDRIAYYRLTCEPHLIWLGNTRWNVKPKTETTKVEYNIGYQIIDGKRVPLTKEQEKWSRQVLDKSLEKHHD